MVSFRCWTRASEVVPRMSCRKQHISAHTSKARQGHLSAPVGNCFLSHLKWTSSAVTAARSLRRPMEGTAMLVLVPTSAVLLT